MTTIANQVGEVRRLRRALAGVLQSIGGYQSYSSCEVVAEELLSRGFIDTERLIAETDS